MGTSDGEDVLGDGDDLGPDAVAGEEGDAVAPGPRRRGGRAAQACASPRSSGSLRIEVLCFEASHVRMQSRHLLRRRTQRLEHR